jgi:flagellar basal-body rod protein FlgB
MLPALQQMLDFQTTALKLRAERQSVLASNIANADTPNYKARDFDFRTALESATGSATASAAPVATDPRHMTPKGSLAPTLLRYRVPQQMSIDGNSVELDGETAQISANTVRYEASLRFLNGQIKTILSAIQGQ